MVEAARIELASLTFEVRSLYMLSPIMDVLQVPDQAATPEVSLLSVSTDSPETCESIQLTIDARSHPVSVGEWTARRF